MNPVKLKLMLIPALCMATNCVPSTSLNTHLKGISSNSSLCYS